MSISAHAHVSQHTSAPLALANAPFNSSRAGSTACESEFPNLNDVGRATDIDDLMPDANGYWPPGGHHENVKTVASHLVGPHIAGETWQFLDQYAPETAEGYTTVIRVMGQFDNSCVELPDSVMVTSGEDGYYPAVTPQARSCKYCGQAGCDLQVCPAFRQALQRGDYSGLLNSELRSVVNLPKKLTLAGIKISLIELRSCELFQELTLAGSKINALKEIAFKTCTHLANFGPKNSHLLELKLV